MRFKLEAGYEDPLRGWIRSGITHTPQQTKYSGDLFIQNVGIILDQDYRHVTMYKDQVTSNELSDNDWEYFIVGDSGDPECSDGVDNDGDGHIDFLFDLDCGGPGDDSEIEFDDINFDET